jgi:hypothetical protein
VALASRGLRDMDTGTDEITEADIKATIQRQARQVQIKSLLSGLAGTALTFLI